MLVQMQRPWILIWVYVMIVPGWVLFTDGIYVVWGNRLDASTIIFSAVRSGILYLLTAWLLYQLISRIIKAERRFRTLVEYSPQPFFVLEEDKWIYANPAGLNLIGAVSLEGLLEHTLWDVFPPDEHDDVRNCIRKLSDEVTVCRRLSLSLTRFDGKARNIELLATPIEFDGKHNIQLVLTDVTNKKRLEQELLQSEKLAAVGQLAAGVAHEIRNPLTTVMGFLQILSMSTTDKQLKYIDIMSTELRRINSIVQEMLSLAKPTPQKFALVNASELLTQVFEFLKPEATMKDIDFHLQLCKHPGPVYITGHENGLKQVLINLVRNAMDALENSPRQIVLATQLQLDKIHIFVRDTGTGIPEKELSNIDTPFYTTKQHGTGLGLHVCRQILNQHNGDMSFDSTVGRGTTVQLTFSTVEPSAEIKKEEPKGFLPRTSGV